ncbi:MAG: M23 family metallopeptidase [Haliscomenobacter sp.]|nr:M23 family metallopeptidase [Haliscomenobacter sp.]MBK7475927.1 M23 family metallopeptidase [Haliscomenobacter sp.]MBK8879555.1 M23 family metallopeptidase [Haliscomenobacter sp.]
MKLLDRERLNKWIAQMKAPYRLIVRNDETLEERASFRLTMMNVYVLLSTVIVLVATLVILLIAYTPVKRYLPGYQGGGNNGREVIALAREVESLEKELRAQQKYTDNVRRMLVGDVQTEKDVQPLNKETKEQDAAKQPKKVDLSEVDRQLRQETELDQLAAVVRQGRSTNFGSTDVPIEQLFFVPPVRGEISAPYQREKSHYGMDILAPKNTAIKATMDGYVFLSDWTLETGNTIGIQHDHNIVSFYKHNSLLLKKAGSFVRAGEAIAIIGNTGTLSSGPHLHFELWKKGKPVDPADYVAF